MFVVSGEGAILVEGERIPLLPGHVVLIEAGERHEVRNESNRPLVTWNVYAPATY